MNQAEVIASTSSFLHECIINDHYASTAVVSLNSLENRYTQFDVIGISSQWREMVASGELGVEIVGLEYARSEISINAARFNHILVNGWERCECGNAKINTPILQTYAEIEKIVSFALQTLTDVYGIEANADWETTLNKELNE